MRKSAGVGDTVLMMAAVELGTVTVPSDVLVLGMAGWIGYWPQIGGACRSEPRWPPGTAGTISGMIPARRSRQEHPQDCWWCMQPHHRRRSTASRRSPSSRSVSAFRGPQARHAIRYSWATCRSTAAGWSLVTPRPGRLRRHRRFYDGRAGGRRLLGPARGRGARRVRRRGPG